jgi:hypothetical protein
MYHLWVAMVNSQCFFSTFVDIAGGKLLSWGKDSCSLSVVLCASDNSETCISESCMKNLVLELLEYYMNSPQHKNYYRI